MTKICSVREIILPIKVKQLFPVLVLHIFSELFQVNEPIPKIEGKSQCSGEAEYINDIPAFPGELTGIFVMATVGNCDLDTVDASAALVR